MLHRKSSKKKGKIKCCLGCSLPRENEILNPTKPNPTPVCCAALPHFWYSCSIHIISFSPSLLMLHTFPRYPTEFFHLHPYKSFKSNAAVHPTNMTGLTGFCWHQSLVVPWRIWLETVRSLPSVLGSVQPHLCWSKVLGWSPPRVHSKAGLPAEGKSINYRGILLKSRAVSCTGFPPYTIR